MIRPWQTIASEPVIDLGLFRVTRDVARSPRTQGERPFYVVHMADWVMVVPLTADGKLVLVRQYRHGAREAGLEVPGGLHDHAGEQPDEGAARELAEESGYGGGKLTLLGRLRPQPALFANRAWIYLALEVARHGAPAPDPGEDLEVVLLDPREVPARIAAGEISNAMTVAALALAGFPGGARGPA
ncbi:MAG: NUDIX hydrolase [Burkholderiales bacterium]|nr:NUDIX hydrolase [Burkholderiales bacterium]